MNKASVEHSIGNIKKCFSKKIIGTNTSSENNSISWHNYKSGIIKGVSYPREYQLLLDERQYSFLMMDSSFFQFYFQFDTEGLSSCRMAYYPVPKIIDESVEDLNEYEGTANSYLRDVYSEMALEMEFNSGQLSSNSHLRFDYDKSVTSHSKSHFQFGGINSFRIAAKNIVLPFAFFEKILLDFHSDWFVNSFDYEKNHVERNHGINNGFTFDENDSFFLTS